MNVRTRLHDLERTFDARAAAPRTRDVRELVRAVFADPVAFTLAERLADGLPDLGEPGPDPQARLAADPELRALAAELLDRLRPHTSPDQQEANR